jgi:hypothetical protein
MAEPSLPIAEPSASPTLSLISIAITPSTPSLSVGQTQQFTATGTDSDGSTEDLTDSVMWSSSNLAVLTVTSSGVVTVNGSGSATLTAVSVRDPTKNATISVSAVYAGMFTYHNDLGRTGQNLGETILTLGNVNSRQFGKLFSYRVDGAIYAQPLYVQSVMIPQQGVHNVVYVATAHDSVYALDANGKAPTPLWQTSFINPAAGVTSVPTVLVSDPALPGGEIGAIGTPVIDPASGTLYAVAYTDENGQIVYRLHALDLATGTEKFGGPVLIQAAVPGTGDENDGQGHVPFVAQSHLQRPGLLLADGVVYIGFGSHNDVPPWHGWLLAYDANTLQQVMAFDATPNAGGGSLWASGGAPAADTSGNIYVATSNGYGSSSNGGFDANSGGSDYGDSILKLQPRLPVVLDWFSPFNTNFLADQDNDLGSGGVMLLPDQPGPHPHLLVIAGKEGRIYLIDRDNLGHYNSVFDTQIVQELTHVIAGNYSTPAYWHGYVYFVPLKERLQMFALNNGLLSTSAVELSPQYFGYAGATPSISANGSTNGILWLVDWAGYATGSPAGLYAYNASNVSQELYDSGQAGSRDTLGPACKFTVPTVFNGKVYVGTSTELDVFGLLAH